MLRKMQVSLGMGLWYRLRSGTAWNRYRWSVLPVYRQSDGNAMIDTMKGEREGVIRARLPSPVRTPATNHARSPRAAPASCSVRLLVSTVRRLRIFDRV